MVITKDTLVEDALKIHPELARVFIQQGMPCLVCGESFWGTIEELAKQYGKDVATVISALNRSTSHTNETP
jgi:hydroxylamine reductase